MIKKLQNAYFVAQNVERMTDFYSIGLGLTVKFSDGPDWVQLDAISTNVSLSSVREAGMEASGAVLVFEVDDLESTIQKAEMAGAQLVSRRDMGGHGTVVTLRDPEQNPIQLLQRLTAPP